MDNKMIKEIFNQYFNGDKNFVTPNVYGYGIYYYDAENVVVFEKSRSKDGSIYGCSALLFNPLSNTCKRIDLSDSFDCSKDVNHYINHIRKSDFENALIYGEDKKIIL